MSDSEKAKQQFSNGLNCSQSILAQYAPKYNLDTATACKLATGFGGGMGRMANTCGALTGAYLVLGLEYGSETSTEKDKKEQTYEKIQQLTRRFEEKHGACTCRDLLGCDISTREGSLQAREQGLHRSKCPVFVKDTVDILENILK